MNIGLLEDNPAILDYLTVALEMEGHTVRTYTQGAELIDVLLTGSTIRYPLAHDLIIVDLLLPRSMHGLEAIKQIQQHIPFRQLPVIVISAGSPEEIERVRKEVPDIPVLRKPFKTGMLLELIEDMKKVSVQGKLDNEDAAIAGE